MLDKNNNDIQNTQIQKFLKIKNHKLHNQYIYMNKIIVKTYK